MAFVHRKILDKSMDPPFIGCPKDDCKYQQPPPLPPLTLPPQPSNHKLSPFLITMLCGLALSFSFICYLTLSTIYRRRQRNHGNTNETRQDFVNEDLGPVIHHHPIWLINTIGLEQSQIESIHVFKYKKGEGLTEGTDCSVCLSEFEDDERLRLLPKCSHAFHVACIDTWLRSHKNCPLCRAPIIKETSDQSDNATIESSLTESSTNEETEGQDFETIDYHVVQVENNGEVEKTNSSVRVQSDLVDRHRVRNEECVSMRRAVSVNGYTISFKLSIHDQERRSSGQLVVLKKPNSMLKSGHKLKGSSSNIHIRSKVMKSSSFGNSSRKASSFKYKCSLINRSY